MRMIWRENNQMDWNGNQGNGSITYQIFLHFMIWREKSQVTIYQLPMRMFLRDKDQVDWIGNWGNGNNTLFDKEH